MLTLRRGDGVSTNTICSVQFASAETFLRLHLLMEHALFAGCDVADSQISQAVELCNGSLPTNYTASRAVFILISYASRSSFAVILNLCDCIRDFSKALVLMHSPNSRGFAREENHTKS